MQKENNVLREQIVACPNNTTDFSTCYSSGTTQGVKKRTSFYLAKLYPSQLTRRQKYEDLY